MPNLKDIQTRIRSVKKTRQITSAMKLVAAAKLKRAMDAASAAKPYQQHLDKVLKRVAASAGSEVENPLLNSPDTVKNIGIVVLTSDRGLCGGFNNNLVRKTIPWMKSHVGDGMNLTINVYGRKGAGAFAREGLSEGEPALDWTSEPKMDVVSKLSSDVTDAFIDGTYDRVYLVYNEFVNVLSQEPQFQQLLPLNMESEDDSATANYRYEPTASEILDNLLPLYVRTLILQSFLETEAGEHASRMTAMDNATRNADDLTEALTLEFNRARQAAITTEIIEIVSGAEALR
jgi:F-type H+-transporting ATPase subunit gamma